MPETRTTCGDFVCGFGEDCGSCLADCGTCSSPLALWLTQPVRDADSARSETTIGALEGALLADLAAAEREIRLAVYALSRRNVATALGEALGRGVDVRLLTECENRKGTEAALLDELELGGAVVRDDRSSFGGIHPDCPEVGGAMHHKFLVVDRRLVWAGSANLTATDLNYNHNHAFRIEGEAMAAYFMAEWDELWAGRFGRSKSASAPLDLGLAGARVQVAFSPGPAADLGSVSRQLVLTLLEQAEARVDFAVFSLTDERVTAALARAPGVQGVVDATSASQSSSRVRELCDSGVDVFVENLPGKVHHKLAALDAGARGAVVIGGSANWSLGGFDENDETLLAIHDRNLTEQAAAEIERLAGDPAHAGGACCFHSAEAFDAASALCGQVPCVCANGLDDDFDGDEDARDAGCLEPFSCFR